MSGSSGGTSTTTQKADPWVGIQPSLSALYGQIGQANANGQLAPQLNTGQVVGENDNERIALDNVWSASTWGTQGDQTLNNATNQAQNIAQGGALPGVGGTQLAATASGAYTDPNNPYAKMLYNAQAQPVQQTFTQSTLPGLLSAYSAAGRYGSGANDTAINSASSALGQTLSNLSNQTIGQNYMTERQNQLGAAGTLAGYQMGALAALPGMSAMQNTNKWNELSNQQAIGQQIRGWQQDQTNATIAQNNYNANLPMMGLQNFSNLLQPGMTLNGQTSTATGAQPSSLAKVGGGALSGAAVGFSVGGPIGAGIGAVGGGLLGIL